MLDARLLTPLNDAPHTRRKLVLSGAAAISGVGSSRRAVAADAAPYRVAMSVILDPHNTRQRGEIVVEVLPEWAPLAAARFKELIELDYYKRTRFHRVLQGMLPGDLAIAQFGISTSRELNEAWLCKTCNRLPDEKRAQSNKRGTLSFAQASQSNTRQTRESAQWLPTRDFDISMHAPVIDQLRRRRSTLASCRGFHQPGRQWRSPKFLGQPKFHSIRAGCRRHGVPPKAAR